MIREIYNAIGQAFDNNNYKLVIKLTREAMQDPNFGLNMNLLYKYAYSLIMMYKVKEGLKVLSIIAKNDTKAEMLSRVDFILSKLENKQVIKLYIKEYLKKGYNLQEGLVVYLKPFESDQNKNSNFEYNNRYPFMIWKIENNMIYAFPIRKYKNHGICLSSAKYLKDISLTVKPNLVVFDVNDILKVDILIDRTDYNHIIQDLYGRLCIFGTIDNAPKNYFVSELERSLLISAGDIISLYDINDHVRRYYYLIRVDEESKSYKGVAISHNNGNIFIKNEDIVDIPFSSYIMEKIEISEENKKGLEESIFNLEELDRRSQKLILKRSILDSARHKMQKILDFFSKESRNI